MKQEVSRTKIKSAVVPAILSRHDVHAERKVNSGSWLDCLAVETEMKFCAENEFHAELFLSLIAGYAQMPVIGAGGNESSFNLKKAISVHDLRWIASAIPNGQRITQTLAVVDRFTGVENADCYVDILNSPTMPESEVLGILLNQSLDIKRFYVTRSMCVSTVHATFEALYEESGHMVPLLEN